MADVNLSQDQFRAIVKKVYDNAARDTIRTVVAMLNELLNEIDTKGLEMTEDQNQSGDVQDPAEPKRVDTAQTTEPQPVEATAEANVESDQDDSSDES